ncbi:MAG: NADH-quinone oxidoreductase subunit NuoF [Deltaproteobacteria bacterium]|nr:NADH-quinone oxidoreductase subunit NuoF [Deltaproteobacteria bacterium]
MHFGGDPKILSVNWDKPDSNKLSSYPKGSRYQQMKRALTELSREFLIDEVKKSNLRGAGGAGFPTGLKWSFVPQNTGKPVYLTVNADESEPSTFKDRYIMERDPHMLIEGIGCTLKAIGGHVAYIFIRGEYVGTHRKLVAAIDEAYEAGILGKDAMGTGYAVDVYVHRGAGAYICGEETGLIEALEGKKGMPRLKPPFPAVEGLFGCPTCVNNVQTIASVPAILEMGGEAFAKLGHERCGGTHLFNVSGHAKNPGIYELPMGTTYNEVIAAAGGMRSDKPLKGLIPGGSSTGVLLPEELDGHADFDSVKAIKAMFGTGGMTLLEEGTCMVRTALRLMEFYHHESCGQCTPCREGCGWLTKIVHRVESGGATSRDLDLILEVASNIMGNTICPLGDAAAMMIAPYVEKFRDEWVAHIENGGCPFPEYALA